MLPVVHVNGFKISERTIYGTMDDKELVALFMGYGYQVRFVEDLQNIDEDMAASMEWALGEIRGIQKAARSGQPQVKPRWPVLILRTPKACDIFIPQLSRSQQSHRGGVVRRSWATSSLKDRSMPTKSRYRMRRKTRNNLESFKSGWNLINQMSFSTMTGCPMREFCQSSQRYAENLSKILSTDCCL